MKSLVSIGSMMDTLDKHIILNQVMPAVYEIDNNEPGVLMAMLGNMYSVCVSTCGNVMFTLLNMCPSYHSGYSHCTCCDVYAVNYVHKLLQCVIIKAYSS